MPSHMLYADGVMIFCRGTQKNFQSLMVLFQQYGNVSGQLINPSKSNFYSGTISNRMQASIAGILGFSIGRLPFTYLGIPIFKGKPRTIHLQPIADKIKSNLAAWKASLLFIAGMVNWLKQSFMV